MKERFAIIEKEFQAIMAAFGIKGDCKFDYNKDPETVRDIVTCTINVYGNVYNRNYNEAAEYNPEEQTANEFVSDFMAWMFEVLADVAKNWPC